MAGGRVVLMQAEPRDLVKSPFWNPGGHGDGVFHDSPPLARAVNAHEALRGTLLQRAGAGVVMSTLAEASAVGIVGDGGGRDNKRRGAQFHGHQISTLFTPPT